MKLQRMPVILVAIAALLGSVVYLQEVQRSTQSKVNQDASKPLFQFQEGDIQAFTLKTTDQTLAFVKVPATDVASKTKSKASPQVSPKASPDMSPTVSPQASPPVSPSVPTNASPSASPTTSPTASPTISSSEVLKVWQMQTPKTTLANDGSVAFLLSLMATGQSQKSFNVPINQLAEFGLAKPLATVDVILKDQKKHQLVLGKPDFNRTALYAQIDPPEKAGKEVTVYLVSLDFENAVQRPLSDWQDQPDPKPSPKQPSPLPAPPQPETP